MHPMEMRAHPHSSRAVCSYCGNNVPASRDQTACPWCGAPLSIPQQPPPSRTEVPPATALEEKVLDLNERLIEAGAVNAEDAFSLGCWMGAFIVALAGLLSYWLSDQNWNIVAIVLVTVTLIVSSLSTLLSLQAKRGAMGRAYAEVIRPEIDALIQTQPLDWPRFTAAVRASLPEEAPLRIHMQMDHQQAPNQE